MRDKVYIEVENDMQSFVRYLIYNKIRYSDLSLSNHSYFLCVDYEDYKKIRRRYKCKVIKYYGKRSVKYFLLKNKYMVVSLVWGVFLLTMLSNTIFGVKINTTDEDLYKIIENSLVDYGIQKYKGKKSFEELSFIKEKILEDNRDALEWIEIKEDGCNYEIMLTKRVAGTDEDKSNKPAHIVAKKDGLIMHITSTKGQKIKSNNDYVKKGDIIISGNIIKNEDDIKNTVRASGEVYGEVWYTVNISVPFKYTEYTRTDKNINHYYLDIFGVQFTIMGKYDSKNVMSEKEVLIDKPYLFFKLYKEAKTVYEYKEFSINRNEAYDEAIKRAEAKIENNLGSDEYVISKKVLKKEEFSSKIVLDIFFKVYENIGEVKEFEVEELNDEGNTN